MGHPTHAPPPADDAPGPPPPQPAGRAGPRAKARDGQGSIYPRYSKRDGQITSWRWQILVEDRATGRRYLRHGSARTEREARKALTRVAAQMDEHRLPARSAARGTVADLVTRYLAAKRHEASPKTYRKEEQFASLHILPAIGGIKQERLTAAHVRELLGALAAEGLAPETIKGIKGTLARALDLAVIDDVLPRNVARLERRKRTRSAGPRSTDGKVAFTPAEVRRILTGSRGDRFHALWATLLYTGVRFGEAAALAWRDFDPTARTLAVSRSLERVAAGEPSFGDPKTYASRRTLRIPQVLVELLRAHRRAQHEERLRAGGAYREHQLVFASAQGAPLMHANLWRSFKGLMKRLGLPGLSPHTCRHTAATNMLYAGVPLPEVSSILGHAGVEVTATIYAHALPHGGPAAWGAPVGLRGLELLGAWYDTGDAEADEADEPGGRGAGGAGAGARG
jgi:integrase